MLQRDVDAEIGAMERISEYYVICVICGKIGGSPVKIKSQYSIEICLIKYIIKYINKRYRVVFAGFSRKILSLFFLFQTFTLTVSVSAKF